MKNWLIDPPPRPQHAQPARSAAATAAAHLTRGSPPQVM
jgi:hypothetical protein